jgi:hypothetical protein
MDPQRLFSFLLIGIIVVIGIAMLRFFWRYRLPLPDESTASPNEITPENARGGLTYAIAIPGTNEVQLVYVGEVRRSCLFVRVDILCRSAVVDSFEGWCSRFHLDERLTPECLSDEPCSALATVFN